jgi:hypothetical protein
VNEKATTSDLVNAKRSAVRTAPVADLHAIGASAPRFPPLPALKRLDEITCFARHKASFRLPTEEWERTVRSGDQPFIACISVEILIVAKLENVSDTAYGKMIWPLCLIAPQV